MAKEQGDKLHDGYSKYVEHGVAIGWDSMEFARMGWADEGDPAFAEPCRARWRDRRAASTWRAISSPTGAAGRRARC